MTGRFPLSDYGRVPDTQHLGETLVLPDINAIDDSDAHLAAFRAVGAVAIIGVPLRKGGRWVASLTVHHGSPRVWTPEEVELVNETAEAPGRQWNAPAPKQP
jgi:GAF domain-containing protein